MIRRAAGVALVLAALLGGAAVPALAEPDWDPGRAIDAYSAALNAHDIPAALALFDDFGSATDSHNRHYERGELREFLVANGFSDQDAHINTEKLHIVANRAVWTYSCSCAPGSTEVRLVTNHNRISVFAIMPPAAAPIRTPVAPSVPWPALAGSVMVAAALGFKVHSLRRPHPRRSLARGRLIAELGQWRRAALTARALSR